MPLFETILYSVAWLICVPLALLLAIFIGEVSFGLTSQKHGVSLNNRPDAVVVMPAHSEAGGLAASLLALKPVVPEGARVLIVADNCTDRTAAIGREAGFEVIERHDPSNRGKGFALAFARDHLAQSPPACIVILDADCVPNAGTIDVLRSQVAEYDVPIQATNLLRADLTAKPMVQISNFAFLVKNLFRQRGAGRIGGVAMLGGTGMAMPWDLFATAPLASKDIVEDLSLGIYALRAGRPPRFAEMARVESAAAEGASALVQRTRWEHGFVQTAAKRAVPLLIEGIRYRDLPRFWMGCHLCVPPLSMLIGLSGIGVIAVASIGAVTQYWAPAFVLAALLTAMFVLVITVWLLKGRQYLAGAAALQLPLYVLWKVPVYLRLLVAREKVWRRTKRSGEL